MIESTQREEEMFAAVLALPAAERRAFLDRTMGSAADTGLRRRIDDLLRAHEHSEDLEAPFHSVQEEAAAARVELVAADGLVGTRIGRFHLLERIGEGGCGIVYLAQQDEPVRRRVALKIIKAGMDTGAVIARFEGERQALALMDHPNIARVFDGGATESGRPYFVMELVRGVPITHYCDQAKLGTADRLKLFLKVCDAVQHAHQKGIIHRDLKPSNILVALNDGVAVPKVIDFGIAKAVTDLRLTEKTLFTRFNDFIGTPAYMSPEQAVMTTVDVDTRSDIYSLGVLLYELLTGQLPFDRAALERAGVDEARRMLREVDPARPSLRVSALTAEERTTVAQRRGIEPTKLVVLLRSDLDWIVLRCLEKDRARRYETVNGLAKDIQRHLDEEPVLARPPTAGYRLQKLLRRHRLAVVGGAAVLAALALGFAISTWQAIRATRAEREQSRQRELAVRERELANAARAHAEGLLGYLLEDFFDELHPIGRSEIIGRFARQLVSYYDNLPLELRNADTDRNRALAKLREGGALLREKHLLQGATALQEGQDFLKKRLAASKDDESATLDYAMSLSGQFAFGHLAANTQISQQQTLAQYRRAADLLRPYARRPNASVRARRLYAVALSELGPATGSVEEGMPYCEEARAVFRALGAAELTDLTLTTCYCAATDVMAHGYLVQGKIEEADRLEAENSELVDRMLAKRPADLEALAMRWGVVGTRSEIAERRFQLVRATEFAEDALLAVKEYTKFDRDSAGAMVGPWFSRFRLSDLYWKLGRVQDSLATSYEIMAQIDSSTLERDWTLPEKCFWQSQINMTRELERHDQAAALRCVAGFTKEAEKLRQLGCDWEPYLVEYTATAKRFASYPNPVDHDRVFADALEDLRRLQTLPRSERNEGYWQGLRTRALWGASANGVLAGRFAEVETLVRREARELPAGDAMLDLGQLEPHLWLALALARQNKTTVCNEELKPLLRYYRHAWEQGDRAIDTARGLGFSLYVQAVNEPADPDGRLRRHAALDEATAVLAALTDAAKQLVSWRMVIDWVATERARQL